MDHLSIHFEGAINVDIPCRIQGRQGTCCLSIDGLDGKAPFRHGGQYQDFLNFPSLHGWKVNLENYQIEIVNKSHGYNNSIVDPNEFVQSWLFFCLLTVVVRTDEPFNMCDLIRVERLGIGEVYYITTKTLETKLTEWHNWMKKDPSQAKFRLMQTDLVIEFARQVVRENLDNKKREDLKIDPLVSLSIMVLGETLSAVKSSMLREMGESILGWQSDDLNGWGYPTWVMEAMPDKCAYTKKALKRQIGPNATLLLAAWAHCQWHDGADYGCSKTECKYVKVSRPTSKGNSAADANGPRVNTVQENYIPRCACRNQGKSPCKPVGPKMAEVYRILRDGNASFPVFQVDETSGNETSVVVKDWGEVQQDSQFTTLSHVWSQGLGNPKSNEVHECQLRFIKEALYGVSESLKKQNRLSRPCKFFWLDTFAIPVENKTKPGTTPTDLFDLRHRSISQMYNVYAESCHSLVIDDDVCVSQNSHTQPELIAAIKLLTSTWMRRLWTLQEAFLSKAMCFPETYNGRLRLDDGKYPGRGFDQLIQDLTYGSEVHKPTILKLSLAEVLRRHLLENLMGREREARIETGNPFHTDGSQLIASAWRSARWRDTSHKEDETIILSTLLNLDFRHTHLESPARHKDSNAQAAIDQRREMMKDFLHLISKHCPGSIPAGIIFLPGERLKLPGYGWAPATWASGRNEDYPYPLSRMEHATELMPEGLVVRYPGIMLHCEELTLVLNHKMGQGFHFPVDRELNEWYQVDLAKKNTLPRMDEIKAGRTNKKFNYMVAVIISRPRPKERLPDTALLVEVYDKSWRRQEKQVRHESIFYARILSRIKITRVSSVAWQESKDQVIGERTKDDQLWCVDDFASNQIRFKELEDKKRNRQANGDQDRKNLNSLKGGILNTAGSAAGTPPPDCLDTPNGNTSADRTINGSQGSPGETNGLGSEGLMKRVAAGVSFFNIYR
ncbi:hypothetical protein PG996_003155 [Apiospora saccharicola]|uniref:Heterokaryon incompatibility domain-containing protein n=1 Tax=Apiospora saccharicola TaxID=335842 RepID=A0ABR1W3D5_9PEZI